MTTALCAVRRKETIMITSAVGSIRSSRGALVWVSAWVGLASLAACASAKTGSGGGGTGGQGVGQVGVPSTGASTVTGMPGSTAGISGNLPGSGGATVHSSGGSGGVSMPGQSGLGGVSGGGSGAGGAAGVSASSGAGGASGSGGAAPTGSSGIACEKAASETVIIGDSYINWASHDLPAQLATLAGESWRLHAVGGASLAQGGIAQLIPDQFESAVTEDKNIKFVVMDGGGNDILIPDATMYPTADCKNETMSPSDPICVAIVKQSFDVANKLFDRMAAVGVSDVLFFFYPHVPDGTPIGGASPNAMLDYALPMIKGQCASTEQRTMGKLRCHFVDMIPVFEGHADYFAPADIHPNTMGASKMAAAIWAEMQKSCMSQHSGCCKP
jgi:hypothetical protein